MEKILISVGVVLSLGGVWLMIRASVYKDPKTRKKWANRHEPISWMLKWGWLCLVAGILVQIAGIWSSELFQSISSSIVAPTIVKNLPKPKEMSWETIKLIMETQDKLATYGLIILGVMVTIWFAINLYFSIYPARKINETREYLEKKIKAEADEYLEKAKAEIFKVKGEIEQKTHKLLLEPKADINMLVGITAERSKSYDSAASHYSQAAEDYNKLGNDRNLGTALKMLLDVLTNRCSELDVEGIEKIERRVSEVSELSSEKSKVLDKLKEFRKNIREKESKKA